MTTRSSRRWTTLWLPTLAGLAATLVSAAAAPGTIEPGEVRARTERGESFLLIDVRPEQQYALGHLEGALNLPAFALRHPRLPAGASIIVYDGGDGTDEAERAYEALAVQGWDVRIMAGGLLLWEALGQPLVRPPGAAPGPLMRLITPEQLSRLLETGAVELTVLDVRPRKEFEKGRVPGARASALERVTRDVGSRSTGQVVVICGDGGEDDLAAAEALRRAGFRAVRVLYGGFANWSAKGLEVAR